MLSAALVWAVVASGQAASTEMPRPPACGVTPASGTAAAERCLGDDQLRTAEALPKQSAQRNRQLEAAAEHYRRAASLATSGDAGRSSAGGVDEGVRRAASGPAAAGGDRTAGTDRAAAERSPAGVPPGETARRRGADRRRGRHVVVGKAAAARWCRPVSDARSVLRPPRDRPQQAGAAADARARHRQSRRARRERGVSCRRDRSLRRRAWTWRAIRPKRLPLASRVTCRLKLSSTKQGLVSEAKVVRSIPMLDEAALQAVRNWRFEPAIVDGQGRARADGRHGQFHDEIARVVQAFRPAGRRRT